MFIWHPICWHVGWEPLQWTSNMVTIFLSLVKSFVSKFVLPPSGKIYSPQGGASGVHVNWSHDHTQVQPSWISESTAWRSPANAATFNDCSGLADSTRECLLPRKLPWHSKKWKGPLKGCLTRAFRTSFEASGTTRITRYERFRWLRLTGRQPAVKSPTTHVCPHILTELPICCFRTFCNPWNL